jgi:conjugal transfer pilin signal peptidase TrbI
MNQKKRFYRSLAITLCSFALASWLILFEGLGIRMNGSESLPYKFFFSKRPSSLKRETLVAIEHPKFPGRVAKRISGLPGDIISIRNNILSINDHEIGPIKTLSSSGKTYTPIPEGVIPSDHYFLSADHLESFDSRYTEFGLVRGAFIKEELWPIY